MLAKPLAELSEMVGGRIVGCEQTLISAALPLQDAVVGCISLADGEQPLDKISRSQATALLVQAPIEDCDRPMLIVDDLHGSFQQLVRLFRPPRVERHAGVHATATVEPGTTVGENTVIGAGVNIGADCEIGKRCHIHSGVQIMSGCRIGDDCVICPNAVLHSDTKVGHRALIQAGVVLGSLGFGYKMNNGLHQRAAQLGWVEIGDDVEIGANSTVDRGTYGVTRIGNGTKVDNLVQIGHNCHVGQHNLICAQVGIAGSSSTGDYVVLAGQVGLADHVHLNDRAVVGAQSGVMRDVPADEIVIGSPAMPRKLALQRFASEAKLPEIRRELRTLQKEIETLRDAIHSQVGIESPDRGAA